KGGNQRAMAEPEIHAAGESNTGTNISTETNVGTTTDKSNDEAAEKPAADSTGETNPSPAGAARKRVSGYVWAALIFTLLAAELYAYGDNGQVRVCVGRNGITDFAQLDKPRQGNIAAGYPFCVESLNLGMYSRSDDVAKEALN